MNFHKHMEAIFVGALVAIGVGSFAFDSLPEAEAKASAPMAREAAAPSPRAVVVRAPTMPRHA